MGLLPQLLSLPATGQAQPSGETSQPNGGTSGHKLLLCTDGTLTGWGDNGKGQLGSNPSYLTTPAAIALALPAPVVRVAVVNQSSFAILADGSLWAWGDNSNGQLGIGNGTRGTAAAVRVPNLTGVVAVAGGFFHTLALCADGTVWSWGQRSDGALGTGLSGAATQYLPQQVTALTNMRAIAGGDQFSLALDASGHAWAWGTNSIGELGLGLPANSATIQATPAQLALGNIRQLDATNVRAAALCADGTVWNWGNNSNGQLGLGHSNYVGVPAQVGPGTITNAVGVAMNTEATIAVRPDGTTYAWGYNGYGSLGVASPSMATLPVAGPSFTPNVQIMGQGFLFTSTERTGTVKTWGGYPLGYTPTSPTPLGGSSAPTTPSGLCRAVPAASFPACGPQRAYYQGLGATYVAIRHGNAASPAEIGTAGTTTVIDASQPPYNGTVAFDGVYHVRGEVRLIGGAFTLLDNTKFYIDSDNGAGSTSPNPTLGTIDVRDATLRLRAATLQANCPEPWRGVALTGGARLYTEAGGRLGKTRSVIRDATTGVYAYTPDWNVPNTNEYYLLQTNFINNNIGLYDLVKGTAQPGEGVRNCSFSGGFIGIQFDAIDYSAGNTYGGNYGAAVFDYNTFEGLDYGISGVAGQAHITNNVFTNNYHHALGIYSPGGRGEVRGNTIVVPAVWPADRLAALPAGQVPTSHGISGAGIQDVVANTIEGATPNPAANSVLQIGMALGNGDLAVRGGNTFRYLDQALNLTPNDLHGSTHSVVGNTFEQNVAGVSFFPYSTAPFNLAPVQVTLRCNTFSSTLANATGVWVQAGAAFPSSLGTQAAPNGNRFDGIADVTKRFVYDKSTPFSYYRYDSYQESFGGTNVPNVGNILYNYSGTAYPPSVISAPNTLTPGANACGSSTTPGVYARSAAKAPATGVAGPTNPVASLSGAYPNPATETAAFSYSMPADGPPTALVLRDLLGREVARQPLTNRTGEVRLSVRHLPAGFYTSALETGGSRLFSQKLTVAR